MVIAVTASALFLALLFIDMFIDIFITAATKLVVPYGMRTVGDVVPGVVFYLRRLHYHSSLVGKFSGLINGPIAASSGALCMLTSEPTAK